MKINRRFGVVAIVACGLLTGACASVYDPPRAEKLGSNSQELLALSLLVNSSVLGTAGVALRVTGPSYDATITGPTATRLPAITSDGTYTISSPAGGAPFGTFVVEGGIVVHATGAVTFGSSGLSFSAARLATVVVAASTLTLPAGLGRYRLGSATNVFSPTPTASTFRLPDGTFSMTTADGTRSYGTFTIADRVLTTTTGALGKLGGTVLVNTASLARVVIPVPSLTTPQSLASVRLGDETVATNATMTAFLPDGVYAVTNNDRDRTFGSFTIAGRTLTAASHGLMLTPTGGLAFDPEALARVTIDTRALAGQPTFQQVRLPKISTSSFSQASVLLPAGTYDVDDVLSPTTAPRHYGSITVTGTSVTAATGALTPAPTGFTFDTSALAEVTIPFSGLKSPVSPAIIGGRLSSTGAIMGVSGGDPVLHLLDGRYTVTRASASSSATWGTFDVANHEVVAGSGIFRASETGKLELQTCNLAAVTIEALPAPVGGPILIPEISQTAGTFPGGTLLLPPGTYTIRSQNPFLPIGRFTVPTQGPLTNVIQPSWISTLSGNKTSTCLKPPVPKCVGTPTAPVDIGFCSVAADATNKLAGSCTDAGGGIASCELDGMTTRTLGAGDHAVLVTGTASDGSSASCTSFVRVNPCGDAPVVSCVGTTAAPATVSTNPGTCGVAATVSSKQAGTCKPGITGLASCTFNGASSTSLAPGTHHVDIVGTSDTDASASCTSHVRVVDTERPQITCAEPITRECEGPSTHVTTTASCVDNCGRCDTECNARDVSIGTTVLSCNSVDTSGNTAFCSSAVTIVDTVAPTLEMTVSPSILPVPNHKMVPISIATTTSDLCDPWANVSCSAWSNEAPLGLGSGHTDADIDWRWTEDTGQWQLYLRAERSGLGTDRVYTIECVAFDVSGNYTTKTATVTVPHDQGR